MANQKQIQKAKEVLKANGYFVDSLWTVSDVRTKFDCTDEQAQTILKQSLTNDSTMEQIWFSIREFGDIMNLTPVVETTL